MSIALMTAVWRTPIGPATRRLVLLALADSANDEGVCWPSIATIAAKANCSRTAAEDAVRHLEADGLLVRHHRYNDSNVYQLDVAAITALATPPAIPVPPPPRSGGTPPENPGPNRKRTQTKNQLPPDAVAPDAEALPLDLPEPVPTPDGKRQEKTPSQRANVLAQRHYDRLGRMGNVPAFHKIMLQAVRADWPDEQIDQAADWIAQQNWTLTAERLATTLRGGPRRMNEPPPAAAGPDVRAGGNGRGPRLEF